MASVHGKDTDIYWGGYDLTGYTNSATVSRSADTAETSVFGNSSKSYIVGLKDGSLSLSGIWSGTTNEIDDRLNSTFATAGQVITMFPSGDAANTPSSNINTVVGVAYLMAGISTTYEIDAGIGDAVAWSCDVQPSGGIDRGLCIHQLAAETSTGNDSASTDFGSTSTSSTGFAANLHMTTGTAITTCTVKLIDSADNSSFADVTGGGFTAITSTSPTSQQLTHASTSVRRYVRTNRAGTFTSITYAVALAKR